jgi:hypothetical protein
MTCFLGSLLGSKCKDNSKGNNKRRFPSGNDKQKSKNNDNSN